MAKKKGASKSPKRGGAKKGGKKGTKGSKPSKREMELKKKEKEKLEKERLEREAAEAVAKQKRHDEEMQLRAVHLLASAETITFYDKVVFAYLQHQKRLRDWEVFTACRNLPDFKLNEINSYMTNWMVDLQDPTLQNVFHLSGEILQLIEELKEFLFLPLETSSVDTIREIGLLFHEFKEKQQEYMDKSTYKIIQDLTEYFDPEEGILDFTESTDQITFSLYGNVFAQPTLVDHNYEKLKFKFKIPEKLVEHKGVYRLLKTDYDHYSDTSNSYFPPGINNALKKSIEDWVKKKAENKPKKVSETSSPPQEEGDGSKSPEAKGKKKGKKGKKSKGKKKKKKSKKKGGSGISSKQSGTETEDDDIDEEYRKVNEELEAEEKAARKKSKKLAKKEKKQKKKGKKGKSEDISDEGSLTENEEVENESAENEEDDDEDDEEGDEGDAEEEEKKPKKKKENVSIDDKNGKETKEERKARRRKEQEDAEKGFWDDDDDDEEEDKMVKRRSDSDSDEEQKKVSKKERRSKFQIKKDDDGGEEDDADNEAKLKKSKSKAKSSRSSKATLKSKPSKKGKKSKGKKKSKKGKKKGKKSKKGKKGKSKGKKKSSKGKGKSKSTSKSQSESASKSSSKMKVKGKKSKSKSKTNIKNRARSKTKAGKGKGKGGKSSSKSSLKSKGSSLSKSKSKSISKSKSKSKSSSKSKGKAKGKTESRGRSKEKKGKGKGVSKSKSKSKSKSTSRGRKVKKSRSRSKKGKKLKGKKSKSKERTKTEAELAKERERAEKAKFIPQLATNELNLRNYVILGGVFHFDFLEVPPQPKERGNWTLHLIESDQSLKEIPFEADFIPPTPPDMQEAKKTPEEMEREAKKQEEELQKLVALDLNLPNVELPGEDEDDEATKLKKQEELLAAYEDEKEQRLDQLVLVDIDVPRTALWFEPPYPVRWDAENRIWSTEGFYDIRFNEDALHLTFRTTKFGTIGLGHNRFSNLPYQSFELKPAGLNKCIFSLMAAMAAIEFTIENDLICVSALQNVSNSEVVEATILNKYMTPRTLIKTLRYVGLDVFPELDSYAYVDGVLLKDIESEEHMYRCMSVLCPAYNFHWSRWNLLAGRERMVFQMRERLGTTTPGNYQMVLNTPLKASLIACTEVSPNFSEEPVADSEYHADLLHLATAIASDEAKAMIKKTNAHFIETVCILITSIRPVSFS